MRFVAACRILIPIILLQTGNAIAAVGPGQVPSESWNEMQKFEYYIGCLAGALNLCRRYRMYAEMRKRANLTPYGKIGLRAWSSYDDIVGAGCGRVAKDAEEILQDKDKLVDYLKAKYDCSSGDCVER